MADRTERLTESRQSLIGETTLDRNDKITETAKADRLTMTLFVDKPGTLGTGSPAAAGLDREIAFVSALQNESTSSLIPAAIGPGSDRAMPGEREYIRPVPIENAKESRKHGARHLAARVFASPYFRMTAALIIFVSLGVGIWRLVFYKTESEKGLAALRRAYNGKSPLAVRLTGFSVAPVQETRGSAGPDVDRLSFDLGERLVLEGADAHDAESYQAAGVLYLLKGSPAQAIKEFSQAVKLDERNARYQCDLGAALLEKRKAEQAAQSPANSPMYSGKDRQEFADALSHLDKALASDRSLSEAMYNRALCYEEMLLWSQAVDDWKEYLQANIGPKWSEDGKQRLESAEEHLVNRFRNDHDTFQRFIQAFTSGNDEEAASAWNEAYDVNQNRIEGNLIDGFLQSHLDGSLESATKSLKLLEYAGRISVTKSGDRLAGDIARFYAGTDKTQWALLLNARSLFKKAYSRFNLSDFRQAIDLYAQAEKLYLAAGDTCEALLVQYRVCHSYILEPQPRKVMAELSSLYRTATTRGYRWLGAECMFDSANAEIDINEPSAGLKQNRAALKLFEGLDIKSGTIRALVQLADEFQSLHDSAKALAFLDQALLLSGTYACEPKELWSVYTAAAFTIGALGFNDAEIAYHREALATALSGDLPLLTLLSYGYLGAAFSKWSRYDEAIASVNCALAIAGSLADHKESDHATAVAFLQLGEIYRRAGEYGKAVDSCDRSIEIYDRLDLPYYRYLAHKRRLMALVGLKDVAAATAELRKTMALFEEFRSVIEEESFRDSLAGGEQDLYDTAIDFEYTLHNDTTRAFQYSEANRARSLADLMRNGARIKGKIYGPDLLMNSALPSSYSIDRLAQIPEQEQIIEYSALDDKLLIWVVSNKGLELKEVKITQADLFNKVRHYLLEVSKPPTSDIEGGDSSTELYKVLISPVESLLYPNAQLCIIPDKLLEFLPFSSLMSPSSHRYLIQDHALTVSSSLDMFLSCTESARKLGALSDERLLSVGDPAFDHSQFPDLKNLPAAAIEARAILNLYAPGSPCLLHKEATKDRITREMSRADVVNLALHSIVDQRSPLKSALVVARGPSGEVLSVADIYRLKFPTTRLVVLSSCQTAIEGDMVGDGAIGIARPFIVGGVPVVTATLWPVDSDATADLIKKFHSYRRATHLPTAEALRHAQLDMISQTHRQPYYWAAFVLIGGYVKY